MMGTGKNKKDLEISLDCLYRENQESPELDLVARYSPLIRLDSHEPFMPLAAGYTIFSVDDRSPSFDRHLSLKNGSRQASFVIEYAIWWDWDINHLYELEHIWVYVDHHGQVMIVEGSWHGKVKELGRGNQIELQEDHPIVIAAPGKHACAPSIAEFQKRQKQVPGLTTRFAGVSGIAVNGLFARQIRRTPIWDRLIHSYLAQQAFQPSWQFSRLFSFDKQMLIPWPILCEWIPDRVRTWLAYLEKEIGPEQYRTLRMVACSTLDEIRHSGELGMDMVVLLIGRNWMGMPAMIDASDKTAGANLLRALQNCSRARIGAYLIILDEQVIPWLARLIGRKDWSDYLMIGATNPSWLALIKSKLHQYRTVLVVDRQTEQAIAVAQEVGSSYIHLNDPGERDLKQAWVRQAHRAELGIVFGPIDNTVVYERQKTMGIEGVISK